MSERSDVWLVWRATLVVALLLYVYPLWVDTPLMDPGEGLHAGIAQEMVEKGDWVVPRFMGEPFLDKPILYTWAQAVSMRWFGASAAAARAPGLLLAMLGVVLVGLMGRRLFGDLAGALAGLFYATMVLPAGLAQTAHHDVAMTPMVIRAFWALWEGEQARGG
ncbi:MAG TPA: glycosyltransferase family 39 protein, partial [Candidatus Brocadiia bacterium]|nr:glycosyltransferase family 39 protein [Candidatus Brocadiia bacterium]